MHYLDRDFLIPRRQQNAAHLERVCFEVADHLAGGAWGQAAIRSIGLTRQITEGVGQPIDREDGYLPEVLNEVRIEFSAHKQSAEDSHGNGYDIMHYDLVSTVSQEIEQDEIPESVRQEMLEDNEDEEGVDPEDLDSYPIEREQAVTYSINEFGQIKNYTLAFRYTLDGEMIHEVVYDTSAEGEEFAPIYMNDGAVIERRPFVVPYLTAKNIEEEIDGIETEWRRYLTDNALKKSLEFGSQSGRAHIRSALGILSLLRTGLF